MVATVFENLVSEKPVIFKPEEIKATLQNRKTQFRRVVKTQPDWLENLGVWHWSKASRGGKNPSSRKVIDWYESDFDVIRQKIIQFCPYGQVGEFLWVRETWNETTCSPSGRAAKHFVYLADGKSGLCPSCSEAIRWRTSSAMPREASRIVLEITNIRVELLQRISKLDCVAEGLSDPISGDFRTKFLTFWRATNFHRGYVQGPNPWVYAISFRRVS